MPWVIPPWLGLVEFLGLTAKANEHDKHDDGDDDGDSDDNDANDKDGGDGNKDDGKWNTTAGMTTTMTTTMMINIDVVEDDDNDWTTTMRWRQVQLDDNDVMAMGGHRHAERSRAPRHPSEATINLCRKFREELTRDRDNFGGRTTEKGQGGGDSVEITSSPLNQFQTYLPATPMQRKDQNLFRMCPGSEATLSAPW
jgi:hypothetical protein